MPSQTEVDCDYDKSPVNSSTTREVTSRHVTSGEAGCGGDSKIDVRHWLQEVTSHPNKLLDLQSSDNECKHVVQDFNSSSPRTELHSDSTVYHDAFNSEETTSLTSSDFSEKVLEDFKDCSVPNRVQNKTTTSISESESVSDQESRVRGKVLAGSKTELDECQNATVSTNGEPSPSKISCCVLELHDKFSHGNPNERKHIPQKLEIKFGEMVEDASVGSTVNEYSMGSTVNEYSPLPEKETKLGSNTKMYDETHFLQRSVEMRPNGIGDARPIALPQRIAVETDKLREKHRKPGSPMVSYKILWL